LWAVVNLKPNSTDRHETSRGLSAIAKILVALRVARCRYWLFVWVLI